MRAMNYRATSHNPTSRNESRDARKHSNKSRWLISPKSIFGFPGDKSSRAPRLLFGWRRRERLIELRSVNRHICFRRSQQYV